MLHSINIFMSYLESCAYNLFKGCQLKGFQDFILSPFSTVLQIITILEVSNKAMWATKKKSDALFSKNLFIKKK